VLGDVRRNFLLLLSFSEPHCSRRQERDAQDIVYALTRYWNRVDFNRMPEQDMNIFAARYTGAAAAWVEVKKKYGM
jgi:hypothetical protein